MNTHTKGDWGYSLDTMMVFDKDENGEASTGIAHIKARRNTDKSEEANAKLIAAAPDLLHEHITDIPLIEKCLEELKKGRKVNAISHLKVILESKQKAIKKATD